MGSEKPHLNGQTREESLLVQIRRPRVEEGSAIWDLVCGAGSLDLDGRHVLPLLVSSFADTCLVAEADGALVGFVGGYRTATTPGSVLLWEIDVDAAFRRQGLGNALLHALIQCPSCADVEYLEAAVGSFNIAARRLLRGFARDLDTSCEMTLGPLESSRSQGREGQDLLRVGPIRGREVVSLERFHESV